MRPLIVQRKPMAPISPGMKQYFPFVSGKFEPLAGFARSYRNTARKRAQTFGDRSMSRNPTTRPALDIYDDLMAISRIEASMAVKERRNRAQAPRDFSRLGRYLPGIKL